MFLLKRCKRSGIMHTIVLRSIWYWHILEVYHPASFHAYCCIYQYASGSPKRGGASGGPPGALRERSPAAHLEPSEGPPGALCGPAGGPPGAFRVASGWPPFPPGGVRNTHPPQARIARSYEPWCRYTGGIFALSESRTSITSSTSRTIESR